MRKYLSLIFLLIFSICLVGCNNNVENKVNNTIIDESTNDKIIVENKSVSFNAKILEVYNSSILVEPLEGEDELKSSDKFSIGYSRDDFNFTFAIGQVIRITYDGMIMESYPAQINASKITLIEDTEEELQLSIKDHDGNLYICGDDCEVSVETKNVSSKGLTLLYYKNCSNEVCNCFTGTYYTIQRLYEGGYINVPYIIEDDIGWEAIALIINNNDITSFDVNWEWLYGELPIGKYRIGKEITREIESGKYIDEMIYAEFEIK